MCTNIEKELFELLVRNFLPSPTMAFDKGIDRIGNMKVFLYANDHNPPHFHIRYKNGINACFSLNNANYLKGNISQEQIKVVQNWFSAGGKEKLLQYKKSIGVELK